MKQPATLPIAWITLRILVVLNWVYAAVVLAILVGLFSAPQWTMTAIGIAPAAQSAHLPTSPQGRSIGRRTMPRSTRDPSPTGPLALRAA